MTYPEYAEINGEKVKINTSYKVGLKCFDVINNPDICDEERALAVIFLLFGKVPVDGDGEAYLKMAEKYLTCGKGNKAVSEKPDIDFQQDESYISASFMSDYKIDLSNTAMHWWQYCELIAGLTENSIMSRIRSIRTYDLSEVKDEKTRRKIIKAQNDVAIKPRRSAAELAAIDKFESLCSTGDINE